MVNHLPAKIKELIVPSYNDALTPIFIWVLPLAVTAAVVLVFSKEKPLGHDHRTRCHNRVDFRGAPLTAFLAR